MNHIRVFFIIKNEVYYSNVCKLIRHFGIDCTVVGNNAHHAKRLLADISASVVLIDVNWRDKHQTTFLDLMHYCLTIRPDAKIVGLSLGYNPDIAGFLEKCGVHGYLFHCDPVQMATRIREIENGKRTFSPM